MNILSAAFFIFLAGITAGCISGKREGPPPLEVFPFVDVKRYAGDWYEIARYPNSFQEGCVGSRATYTMREDGKIDVLNQCYEKTFSGKLRAAKGKAWIVDPKTQAKLKVSFFWPFSGDYWIIDLGADYEYTVVGHPDRKYLWILSRTKKMDAMLYKAILSRLESKNYDISRLIRTEQQEEL